MAKGEIVDNEEGGRTFYNKDGLATRITPGCWDPKGSPDLFTSVPYNPSDYYDFDDD